MRRRSACCTACGVALAALFAVLSLRTAGAVEPLVASTQDSPEIAGAVGAQQPTAGDVEYGEHGGVMGLPAGSYVCVVYDARRRTCLVRAITEAEIRYAILAADNPNGPPGWMRASIDVAVSAAAIGLPVDNAYQLPGLMTDALSPQQIAMVRCLANSELGRELSQWDDASVYREGIIERCATENEFEGGVPSLPSPVLPLAARHIQEAVAIVVAAQRLATANVTYFNYAGRYAGSTRELLTSAVLTELPPATPLMSARGYVVERGNRIVIDLKAPGVDVCRALNLIHGRPWATLPDAMPPGYRAGCYPYGAGFRFEYRP